MKQHRYRITLEHLATATGEPGTHAPLSFEAGSHDDLFELIARVRAKELLDADASAAMITGLKVFGEIVLKNRDNPLFADMREPLHQFIMKLKKTPAAGAES